MLTHVAQTSGGHETTPKSVKRSSPSPLSAVEMKLYPPSNPHWVRCGGAEGRWSGGGGEDGGGIEAMEGGQGVGFAAEEELKEAGVEGVVEEEAGIEAMERG